MEDFTKVESFTIVHDDFEVCSNFEVFAVAPLIDCKKLAASSASRFHTVFTFSYSAAVSDWTLYDDISREPEFLRQMIMLVKTAFTQVTNLQEQLHESIAKLTEDLHLRGDACLKVVDFAVKKAQEAVELVIPNHDEVLYLDIGVAAIHNHFFVERLESIEGGIQHSMNVDEVHMIPTKDSSIESLESKKVSAINSGSCSICLDEFSEDCEATYMPCLHFFHGDCIKKWLKTSHNCLICCFEMLTS